jgi:hypothetical protein
MIGNILGGLAGGLLGGLGGKPKPTTQTMTSNVNVPSYLQPLVNQSTGIQGQSLEQLQQLFGQGFNPFEQQAQQQMVDFAGGAGGFLPTAQNQFMQTAQGMPLQSFLPESVFQQLSGGGLDPIARQTLQQTAQGDFLHGGSGFNAALEAAQRAAMPGINSTFGMAGRSGSGLAQTAMAQATSDAFARLYGQERQNQLGAAGQLGQFGMAGASTLAGLSDSERQRQMAAAGMLPEIGMMGSNILGQVGGMQRQLPVQNMMQLLGASQGVMPATSLLGNTSTGSQQMFANRPAGILGGAMVGSQIGGMFGGSNPFAGLFGGGGMNSGFNVMGNMPSMSGVA